MDKNEEDIGIKNAIRALSWNRRLLNFVGVWPLKIYEPNFVLFFIYLTFHCTLTFAQMIEGFKNIDELVTNMTEIIVIMMTLVKITVCRVNRKSLGQLLLDIQKDFVPENYQTEEERKCFMKYTKWPGRYIVVAVISMAIATTLYYFNALLANLEMEKLDPSVGHHLPYQTLNIIDLSDNRLYIVLCVYQFLIVPAISCGYVGFDCLFANLTIHITTQFAILTCKVKKSLNNSNDFRWGVKNMVLRHRELIRLSEVLEDHFNQVILQQLFGTTMHICVSGYHALVGTLDGQPLTLIIFISYGFCAISTLFIYCYVGECLIQESSNFGNALYNYEWYTSSPKDAKLLHICMLRTKKPQQLTSGKFCVLSLTTFTDILKASMGYLSVLRRFM